MKKNIILLSFALIAGLFSCTGGGSKPQNVVLKTDADSLSYAFGQLTAQNLHRNLAAQYKADSLKVLDSFLEGFKSAVQDSSIQARAYRDGLAFGDRLASQFAGIEGFFFSGDTTQRVNRDAFVLAFYQAAKGIDPKMTHEQAEALVDALQTKALLKQFGANKAAGEAFLAQNATKEGVKVLPSGLQYRVIKEGTGAVPTAAQTVKVNYTGRLMDGTVFDQSKEPFEVDLKAPRVIPGWVEVLNLMPVGSKWEVFIPQDLAYGEQGNQNPYTGEYSIQPFTALVFDIEMLGIVPETAK